jgi:phosphomannomutase/phosphoglucomutase
MKANKDAEFKSYEWINTPVIGENMFREYDLRNPMIPMQKGAKEVNAGVNTEGMFVLGKAYGTYVQKVLKEKKIAVSCDYREYSKGNAYAFMMGVISTGVDVLDIGVTLTPIMYFSQYYFNLKGGAMVTSSHNDNGWTGLKLAKGLSQTFEPEDIQEYKKLVYSGQFLEGKGKYEKFEGIKEFYYSHIKETVKKHIGKRKLKVVVSGANGGGSLFLSEIIEQLGFKVLKFECELDWNFPKFNPNPENLKFINAIGEFVRKNKADLGVAIDGDGDRFGAVDENGEFIFADRAALFIARYLVQQSQPEQKIVIDVKSTGAFSRDTVLNERKTRIVFAKTGHSYVKAKSREIDALSGFEKSGHFFFRKEFGKGYDDGCMSAAWFTAIMSNQKKTLSQAIQEQPKSYQSPTMEPSTTNDKVKYEIVDQVTKKFQKMKEKKELFAGKKIKELITINGVRVILENDSWGLIRASSNQPVLVMTAESFSSRREMYDIVEAIQKILSQFKDVGEYDQTLPPYPGELGCGW